MTGRDAPRTVSEVESKALPRLRVQLVQAVHPPAKLRAVVAPADRRDDHRGVILRVHLDPLSGLPLELGVEALDGVAGVESLAYLPWEGIEREDVAICPVEHVPQASVPLSLNSPEGLELLLGLFPRPTAVDLPESLADGLPVALPDVATEVPCVVHQASLVERIREDLVDGLRHAAETVRDEHAGIGKAAIPQAPQQVFPEACLLCLAEGVSQHLPEAAGRDSHGDEDSLLLDRRGLLSGPFEGHVGRVHVDERTVLYGLRVELGGLADGLAHDALDGRYGDTGALGLGERPDDFPFAHASAVEAHDPAAEVIQVVPVLLQQLRREGKEPCPGDLDVQVSEACPDLAPVVAVPGGVLSVLGGLLQHGEELLRDGLLNHHLVGLRKPCAETLCIGLGRQGQVGGEECLADHPVQRLRVSVDDSPKFVLAKLADLFYTFHGAVFLSLCFDRLNDKTTAPLVQNFSFLFGTSSNKESHTLLLTSSYLHILYLTTYVHYYTYL